MRGAVDLPSDRYRVERELGRGGMATVYLAEDLKHQRQVAIKVLKPDVAAVMGRDRFLREIEVAARLSHPHIVPLFDSGAAGDLLYYVMPFVPGESLRARLAREHQLPVEEALRLAREIASALGHAHQHGVVHRDIKPENILLVDGMALVADFGIVRTFDTGIAAGTRLTTAAGSVLGTPSYMSPEQASGLEVDQRSDIYSLSCVLFEMLAGQPPLVAPTADAILRMHVTVEPRPVTDQRPAVSAGVSRVIGRGLAKVPADRYQSAAQFAEALTAATTSVLTPAAPLVASSAPPNNLPRPRTHFIGRTQERAECIRLLASTRVLTLTGVGGGGKTRLAQQVAAEVLDSFPDGVWFVDLGPLSDGGRVAEAVAAALGIREVTDRDVTESLREHVRDRSLLLMLDNCEHLLAAAADLTDMLLAAGDNLRVLVTSREGLGVEGERLLALRPMGVPGGDVRDLETIARSEAVQLFVDRAQRAVREFALSDANAEAMSDICRRLDGIPLAIELAAARVKVLSVEQIRTRLDDRFRLLTGGSKSALPRHQTLHAAIQWSYDQLAPDEQRLLRVLSVFTGGWTLDAAGRVTAGEIDEFGVLDLLSRLVDKSLVLVDRPPGGDPRYGLLETVRQYAAERLIDAGEAARVRERHAEAMLAIAEVAYRERITREATWSAVLEAEHDNLRAALALLRETDGERYLQLAGALAWFWMARSHLQEARAHLMTALDGAAGEPPRSARARASWGVANLRAWQGDAAGALQLMEASLEMWRSLGDPQETALALEGVGWAQLFGGDDERARTTFEECLGLHEAAGDPHLVNRARVALGQVLVATARVAEARAVAREIIGFSQAHRDRRSEHSGWHYLADCALIEGNCADSLDLYRQSLVLAQETGDRIEISFEIQGIAMSLAGLGEPERALRLAGAVAAEWERMGVEMQVRFWNALLDRYLGPARETLGEAEAARRSSDGRAMPYAAAIAEALEASETTRARPAAPSDGAG